MLKTLKLFILIQILKTNCTVVNRSCISDDEFYCDFIFETTHTYTCSIANQEEIFDGNGIVIKTKVIGEHSKGRSDADVTKILIESSSRFSEVPGSLGIIFPNIETLEISQHLTSLSSNSLRHFPNLRVLILKNNKIKTITSDSFIHNQNLTTINLMNNEISEIEPAAFVHLSNLKILYLRNNFCVNREFRSRKEILKYFRNSTENCLTPNKISVCMFSNAFFDFVGEIYYCEVQISKNNFEDVRGLVGKHSSGKSLKDVEGFIVRYKTCHKIPENLGNFITDLKVLKIIKSYLKGIKRQTLEKLPKLEWIKLSGNEIEEVEGGTFDGNLRLKYVDLSGNLIKKINLVDFGKFKQLKILDLRENECVDEIFGSPRKSVKKSVEEYLEKGLECGK